MQTPYIIDAVRSPRAKGKDSGAFASLPVWELGAQVLRALVARNQLAPQAVEDLALGCVTQVQEQGGNLARLVAREAGWPVEVAAYTLNRFCGSGLESVNQMAAQLGSGMLEVGVAGGVESMSRVPMGSDGGAFYPGSSHQPATQYVPQGLSAELIATAQGYSRADLDAVATRSHRLAHQATTAGHFASLVPITDKGGSPLLAQDETIRPQTTPEALAELAPVFEAWVQKKGYDKVAREQRPDLSPIRYQHTAGNSSAIVDGAAAVLLASQAGMQRQGLTPKAKIRSWAVVGSDPLMMLTGTVPATQKALRLAGMQLSDIDLVEVNEAFASVVLYYVEQMKLPMDKVNVNGGAIAMGHPLGATGAMLLGTLVDELIRRDLQTGLVTMCIGAGMGIATVIERV